MPSNKILICTATYNESENIIDLIKAIENLNIDLDILIIDDNSPDNTGEIIQNYINNKDNIILKTRESKSGLDTAHKYAYKYAKKIIMNISLHLMQTFHITHLKLSTF